MLNVCKPHPDHVGYITEPVTTRPIEGVMDITRMQNEAQTIPQLLEKYRESEALAVICGDEAVSYRQLISDARKIASGLWNRGVRKGDRVVLAMSRSADYVRAWLGVLCAGAVQVTFHEGWPAAMKESAIQECRPVLTLDDASVRALLASQERQDGALSSVGLRGEDPFQIVYTSGSTGTPKGVINCHLTAVSRTSASWGDPLPLCFSRHCDRLLLDCSPGFVLSSFCLCLCLLNEKTVVLARREELRTPQTIAECSRKNHVDTLHISPSRFLMYREDPAFAGLLRDMKLVLTGSEAISERTARLLKAAAGGETVFIYGASELFGPALFRFGSAYRSGEVTFSAPPSCECVLVLNEAHQPSGPGEEGELCFGGIPGRLGGYFGTQASPAFMEHPDLGRLYRTGDLAIKQADGRFCLLGRRDSMVKLFGMRIEPAAVERAIMEYPGVRQAAVKVRGEGNEARLWAWYSADETVEASRLRRHLSRCLPAYMVPAFFVRMDELPINQNGKLDRRALS